MPPCRRPAFGRTQHEERAKQLKKVKTDIVTTTDALREAEASLTALAAQAGVADIEAIAPAVQRANERVLAARQVEEQEKALRKTPAVSHWRHSSPPHVGQRDRLDQDIDSLDRRPNNSIPTSPPPRPRHSGRNKSSTPISKPPIRPPRRDNRPS